MKIIYNDGHVDECPADDELHVIRHTAAHILAQAVKHLYPQAHFAYGPATEKGFHYDVDLGDVKLSDEDLKTIEKEMQAIVKQNLPIKPFALGREDAIKLMQERGEIYKVEHIGDLPEDATLTFYQQGDYIDMCVGPHLCYTKALKAFKLTALSGAYWKNDKNNKMLTRIGGIAFRNQEELNEYLKMMEEAEKRDHRKIGKEMGLFMLCDEGPGFPFFLPKGMQLKNALIDYWRDIHYAADYVEVSTPMIMSRHLWETSGHWDHYKDNMYSTKIDDEDYCIKPMNCPGGVMVYRSQPHSYRDLPLRVGELGLVHRHELKGALHGLFRVRCFTQDDAHIFMTREQIPDEIAGAYTSSIRCTPSSASIISSNCPPVRRTRWVRTRTGRMRPTASKPRWKSSVCPTSSTRATARSTARRLTSTCATASAVPGSAARFSWTSRCR